MEWLIGIGLANALTAAVLALAVAAIAHHLRRPAWTHALWMLVLVKLVTPPVWDLPLGIELPPELLGESESGPPNSPFASADLAAATDNAATAAAEGQAASPASAFLSASAWRETLRRWRSSFEPRHWIPVIVRLWIFGAVTWFVVKALRIGSFCRFLRSAQPAPAELQLHADRLARQMGLRRSPPIWLLPGAVSPMLWGVGSRARLLFPEELLERLSSEAQGTLIVHELAHYRRGDHWVRGLELIIGGLFWWHPLVWIARQQIEIAEEECCDAWVVAQCQQPRCYAEALLETLDFLSGAPRLLPPAATGIGQVPFLRRRLFAIMEGAVPKTISPIGRLLLAVVAAVLLPMRPSFGNSAPVPDDLAAVRDSMTNIDAGPAAFPEEPATEAAAIEPSRPATPPTVWAKAVSPDGRSRISALSDGQVWFDDDNGRKIDLTPYGIRCVAFSPFGRLFATSGMGSSVVVWNTEFVRPVARLTGHGDVVQSVAFSPEGWWLASGGRDGSIILWDLAARLPMATLGDVAAPVNFLTFSRDGRRLAVAAGDRRGAERGRVLLCDVPTLNRRSSFETELAAAAVAFHSDGQSLVAGQSSGKVTFFDLESGKAKATSRVALDIINAASFFSSTSELSELNPKEPPSTWFGLLGLNGR